MPSMRLILRHSLQEPVVLTTCGEISWTYRPNQPWMIKFNSHLKTIVSTKKSRCKKAIQVNGLVTASRIRMTCVVWFVKPSRNKGNKAGTSTRRKMQEHGPCTFLRSALPGQKDYLHTHIHDYGTAGRKSFPHRRSTQPTRWQDVKACLVSRRYTRTHPPRCRTVKLYSAGSRLSWTTSRERRR